MRFRKIIGMVILLIGFILFSGCSNPNKNNIKAGLIITSDNTDPYIAAHINGIKNAMNSLGISEKQLEVVESFYEDNYFNDIDQLSNKGCSIIFGVGENLEDYFAQSATEHTDIQYCFADGDQAENGLDNYHNYSFTEYQTRYISGIAAGMKIEDMLSNGEISDKDAQLGYIASFPDSENISAYTAYYLGAKSVNDHIKLKVQYTYSDNSQELEKKAALALIANGCKLITQQSYLGDLIEVFEKNNVYYVGFMNGNNGNASEKFIASGQIDMTDCYIYAIECMLTDNDLPAQWSKASSDEDFLYITELNENSFSSKNVYEDAKKKVIEAKQALNDGSLHIFDTKAWNVNGKKIKTTQSEALEAFYNGKEYINQNGYFMENELSSKPKFGFKIDGIYELNYMEDYIGG